MTFDDAFDRLLGHEGGYVNDPRDPGGETRYGISKRAYPDIDIAGLTVDQAKVIYRRDYWVPAGCEFVPGALCFELFDMAVNAGVRSAVRCLQRALNVDDDGVLGPLTLRAMTCTDPALVLRRMQGGRLLAYTQTKTWSAFGAGWVRRVARNMIEV